MHFILKLQKSLYPAFNWKNWMRLTERITQLPFSRAHTISW